GKADANIVFGGSALTAPPKIVTEAFLRSLLDPVFINFPRDGEFDGVAYGALADAVAAVKHSKSGGKIDSNTVAKAPEPACLYEIKFHKPDKILATSIAVDDPRNALITSGDTSL